MNRSILVTVDSSRFPGRAREAYLESFRTRRMDHQFHYDTERQAQLWLAIHEAYSPARNDADCLKTYAAAFKETASILADYEVAVVSLGCGGGQKDAALVGELHRPAAYLGMDVSLPLTLTACSKIERVEGQPVVADLSRIQDLRGLTDPLVPKDARRLFAFFGMLPNFEPHTAFGLMRAVLRKDDLLIFSANLAPGPNYERGTESVLPQYDNLATRHWLAAVLIDAGLDVRPNELMFSIVAEKDLLRIQVDYRFPRKQLIQLDQKKFSFKRGDRFRLFFSYRYTPDLIERKLCEYQMRPVKKFVTAAGNEGVFLCTRAETLSELLAKVTPENRHELVDWGPDVGKEIVTYTSPTSTRRGRGSHRRFS